jgi:surfeit locus 1 family protein
VLAGVAILCALGVWQLQRLQWKTALLQRIAALQVAPAEPLSVVLNRLADGRPVNFSRVVTACDGLGEREAHLYGLRTDGPGWREVSACRLASGPYGSILVDMGFSRQAGLQPPRGEPVTLPAGALITGVLRAPDPRPWFADLVAPPSGRRGADGEFYGRDIPAMAAVVGAPRPAPVMLMLERPAAGPGLLPSPLPTGIENNHLGYAVTWFGLAAALVGVWIATIVAARRKAR